jgi:2-hydroxychromene-2-carboxylate isomerase
MEMPDIEFWYDFASPYSYLAADRIERLAASAGAGVAWRPFLLGPIFARRAHNPSPFQNADPAERRYRWRDIERICRLQGVPWRPPTAYPRNGLLAARVALIAIPEGWGAAFSRAVFHANFAEDQDITNPDRIASIIETFGHPASMVLERAQNPANKTALKAQVDVAIAQGIFGAPSFMVAGELFWGNDRLDQAIAWARQPWLAN